MGYKIKLDGGVVSIWTSGVLKEIYNKKMGGTKRETIFCH